MGVLLFWHLWASTAAVTRAAEGCGSSFSDPSSTKAFTSYRMFFGIPVYKGDDSTSWVSAPPIFSADTLAMLSGFPGFNPISASLVSSSSSSRPLSLSITLPLLLPLPLPLRLKLSLSSFDICPEKADYNTNTN